MNSHVPSSGPVRPHYDLVATPAALVRYRTMLLRDEELTIDAETLKVLQTTHLDAFPYSNLDCMLGRRLFDLESFLEHLLTSGHGGICYQLNYSLSLVLRAIGFRVDYLRGTVSDQRGRPGSLAGNHLGLRVSDGTQEWLVDAGLGDGLREPVPLLPATIRQGPFTYELIEKSDAWVLVHDRRGAFAEVAFEKLAVGLAVFEEPARQLVSEFGFRKTLVVMRRLADEVRTLRGRVFDVVGREGRRRTILETPDQWLEVLASQFTIFLETVTADERAELWRQVSVAHEEWLATGG